MKLPNFTKKQKASAALVVGVGVAAYLLLSRKGGIFANIKKFLGKQTAEDIEKSTTDDIKKLAAKGVKPTYYESQYVQYADKLYNAMITSNPFNPTDENAIYSVMQDMKNDVDILLLVKSFGTRRMEFSTKGGGLAAFLQDDLSSKEMAKVNKILSDNNISYRF